MNVFFFPPVPRSAISHFKKLQVHDGGPKTTPASDPTASVDEVDTEEMKDNASEDVVGKGSIRINNSRISRGWFLFCLLFIGEGNRLLTVPERHLRKLHPLQYWLFQSFPLMVSWFRWLGRSFASASWL